MGACEIDKEDLLTDEEKQQDAFVNFLANAQTGQKAKINFCGEIVIVEVNYKREEGYGGLRPENQRVSLKVLTRKSGDFPKTLVFDTENVDDTELICIY